MRLFVIGNSHVWSLMGWIQFAGHHESTRMDASVDGLDLVGIAVTGATAHNLIEDVSSTGGGVKCRELLDSDPDPAKMVLAVFGDIDIRGHVRGREMMEATLGRYLQYLESLAARPDVRGMLVSSITGYHGPLAECMDSVREWNGLLEAACVERGWPFVDLLTPGTDIGSVDKNNHLAPEAQGPLLSAVRAALSVGEASRG